MKPIYLFLAVILCVACLSKSKDTTLGMSKENNDKEVSEIKLQGELLHCDSIIWGVKLVAKVGKNMIVQAKSGSPVFWVYIKEATRKLCGMAVNLEDDEPCIVSYTLF